MLPCPLALKHDGFFQIIILTNNPYQLFAKLLLLWYKNKDDWYPMRVVYALDLSSRMMSWKMRSLAKWVISIYISITKYFSTNQMDYDDIRSQWNTEKF